jgi:hypothetical protein
VSDATEPGDRPDRPARNTARSNERAARNNDRGNAERGADRPARPERSDAQRPPRSNDRPAYNADRPARGNSDRPARSDSDRPARSNDRPAYNSDRPARSNDRPSYNSGRPARSNDRPAYNSDRPARSSDRPSYNSDRPARSNDRPARSSDRQPGTGRPPAKKLWTDNGAPARNNRDAGDRNAAANAQAAQDWEDRDPFNTRSVRPRHDDPIIPEDALASDLDRVARNELKTLAKDNAEGVAQHLVMAARLIESDPATAHLHALSAARRAGRIGVVRETLAITAYAIEDYALALRELRTYRRITGRDDQLPLMVDSERALGRPDKALELARSVPKASLPVPVQVELAIAMSGARLDQGNPTAALQELTIPQLNPSVVFSYSPALFAAYATCLEDLGRDEDAELWWAHADTAADALAERDTDDDGETIDIIEDDLDDDYSEYSDDIPVNDEIDANVEIDVEASADVESSADTESSTDDVDSDASDSTSDTTTPDDSTPEQAARTNES